MPDITIGVNRDLRGGLDSDTDIQNLAGGNYPDCVNVERNNSGIGGADAPSDGNAITYTLPELQKQEQRVRVFNNLIDFQNERYNFIRMSLYNANGFLIRNTYITETQYNITNFQSIRLAVIAQLALPVWNTGLSIGSVFGGVVNGDESYPNGYFDIRFNFEYDSYTFELAVGFGDLSLLETRGSGGGVGIGGGVKGDNIVRSDVGLGVVAVVNTNAVGTPIVDSFTEFNLFDIKIIQEAYSASAAGKPHLIGSKENNSQLFMCWTTKTKEKSQINTKPGLTMYVNPTTGIEGSFKLWINTFPTKHEFIDYQSIIAANLQFPFSIYNGTWVIRVVDEYTFYLAASNYDITSGVPTIPTKSKGDIYTNVDGVGLFIVQSYLVQSNTYQYKIPLKSKQLNWDTKHQIDLDVEFFNNVYSLYYNDFLNRPRVTYFNNPIETDSAIEAINPDGQYEYERLSEQIKLQQDSGSVTLKINNQYQSGGNLISGVYRYGVVLVTEQLTETEISDLTNQVNVYTPIYNGQNENNVYGTFTITNKINEIYVEGIEPGIFKYIDLVCVYSPGTTSTILSLESIVVSRTQLGEDQTQIVLKHSGNEIDTRSFSLAKLSPVKESILKAYNNVIGENRLLISNFENTQSVDISSWVSTFKYSIKRKPIYWDFLTENNLGFSIPYDGYKVDGQNDYECPVGYQLYEWYRFYVVAELIEGGFTDATFCFDVRFVTQDDYEASFDTENDFRFLSTNGYNRRDLTNDELTEYNLNPLFDIDGLENERLYYQYGIEINNVNWGFSINGVKASDIFKRIKVCRAERVPEVLHSGFLNQSLWLSTSVISPAPDSLYYSDFFCSTNNIQTDTSTYEEVSYSLQLQTNLSVVSPERYEVSPKYGSYYSTDVIFGQTPYDFIDGDSLLVIGRPRQSQIFEETTNFSSFLRKLYIPIGYSSAIIKEIEIGLNCKYDEQIKFPTKETITDPNTGDVVGDFDIYYTKKNCIPPIFYISSSGNVSQTPIARRKGVEIGSPVLKLKEKLTVGGFGFNYGLYSVLYFRKRKDKYGQTTSNNDVFFTGYYINNKEESKIVFGGDVYTQQTYIKKVYPYVDPGPTNFYGAGGLNIISQNKLNTQLRVVDIANTTNLAFPINTQDVGQWLISTDLEQIEKNSAYKSNESPQLNPVYDPNNLTRSTFPSRIIYSELKPNGSVKDFYRLFPPGQFRDNPNNFGAIIHMDLKQGELFTLQELCYTREFLNSTGQLSTIDSGQVIIGDASVLSRPGIRLTSLGSKHKWSYARGLTDAGTDVRCWVNSDFFVVLRAGRDGTVNLTERSFMDTYLRDHMRFVRDKFTPADGQGIHAVWDDVGKNFVITVRGWKDNVEWGTLTRYFAGTLVRYKEQYGVPFLYRALVNIVLTEELIIEPDSPQAQGLWERIPFDDINYYSVFTLCFNEARNRFTHFQTFFPKIYATQFDRYFSPKPHTDESNKFYLMRQGEPLVFYDEEHEGYTEYVINQEPAMLKKFVSIAYNALLKPLRAEFKTQFVSEEGIEERVTTLDRSEFKIRENIVYSTIKNTLDENGQNNQRTAPMKGLWLRIKTFFKARENQKINDIFVPIRMGQRNVKNP